MEQHDVVATLAKLRRDMFLRVASGENVEDLGRVFRAAAECVVDGELSAAKWILCSARVTNRETVVARKIVPIALVRRLYGKRTGGR